MENWQFQIVISLSCILNENLIKWMGGKKASKDTRKEKEEEKYGNVQCLHGPYLQQLENREAAT